MRIGDLASRYVIGSSVAKVASPEISKNFSEGLANCDTPGGSRVGLWLIVDAGVCGVAPLYASRQGCTRGGTTIETVVDRSVSVQRTRPLLAHHD